MIYLDNSATGGRKPTSVTKAVSSALKNCANPGRSGHKLSIACANIVKNARQALLSLFNGYSLDRVIFTKNCTEALNIAIFGLLNKGDKAVTTCLEHNSVLRPLHKLEGDGVSVAYIGIKDGRLDYDSLKKAVNEETHLVAVTLASNVTGYAPDIALVRKIIPENTLLLCDGAQAAGHFEVDMKKNGIDILAVAGHKGLNGICGSGALLFSERANVRPLLYGGTGSMSLSLDQPDFYPDALESGTLDFPAIVSMFEGALYTKLHLKENGDYVYSLTEYLVNNLKTIPDIKLYSSPNRSGIVAFAHKKYPSEELASILSEKYDIAVRGGFHCAPLMHKALGTDENGLVRASVSEFNTAEECEALVRAIRFS